MTSFCDSSSCWSDLKAWLQVISALASLTLGLIALLAKTHDEIIDRSDESPVIIKQLNWLGKITIIGLILSFVIAAVAQLIEQKLDSCAETKENEFRAQVIKSAASLSENLNNNLQLTASLNASTSALTQSASIILDKQNESLRDLEDANLNLRLTSNALNPIVPATLIFNLTYPIWDSPWNDFRKQLNGKKKIHSDEIKQALDLSKKGGIFLKGLH